MGGHLAFKPVLGAVFQIGQTTDFTGRLPDIAVNNTLVPWYLFIRTYVITRGHQVNVIL